MSRQHAQFVLSATNKVSGLLLPSIVVRLAYTTAQEVYLRDLDSTHGTYVGNRRIQAKVDYLLSNGETITFGSSISIGSGTLLSMFEPS